MRLHPTAFVVVITCLVACQAKLGGDVKIDGEAFEPTSCRSGQVNGFAGADLTDNAGRTLRIVQTPTNQPLAVLISGDQVVDLGPCGTLALERQNSTVNDITNVKGNGTLKCESQGHSVEGTVAFENCH